MDINKDVKDVLDEIKKIIILSYDKNLSKKEKNDMSKKVISLYKKIEAIDLDFYKKNVEPFL